MVFVHRLSADGAQTFYCVDLKAAKRGRVFFLEQEEGLLHVNQAFLDWFLRQADLAHAKVTAVSECFESDAGRNRIFKMVVDM